MKIVHVSDTHIQVDPIMGSDPVKNFRLCAKHVLSFQSDADLFVLTGDLTHHGLFENYTMLKDLMAETGFDRLEPRLLLGNHDNRDTFLAAFPEAPTDRNGFVQWVEETPQGRLVFLDTVQPGTHAGHYCETRQAWLRDVLDETAAQGSKALLFMHHNPLLVHVANADQLGIVQANAFQEIVREHAATLRHIFFGHTHFSVSGALHGVPVSAPRSTCHPNWPDFSGNRDVCGYGGLSQNYDVAFVQGHTTLIHTIDFMAQAEALWVKTEADGWVAEDAV